jgi:hypothetical protein
LEALTSGASYYTGSFSKVARNDRGEYIGQGLTLIHFSGQPEPFLPQKTP